MGGANHRSAPSACQGFGGASSDDFGRSDQRGAFSRQRCFCIPRPQGQVDGAAPDTGRQDGTNRSTVESGASISSILPSRVRCSTINLPLGSRNTKTSLSRKCTSLIASSKVIGRSATESLACTRCTSVVRATDGNL